MAAMKPANAQIGAPVTDPPPARFGRRHRDVYIAAMRAPGAWIPAEFETALEADALRSSVRDQADFEAKVRNRTTVYVRYIGNNAERREVQSAEK